MNRNEEYWALVAQLSDTPPELAGTVERARARIEAYLQEQLLTREKGVQGVIFNLTANYGWRDRKEVALSEETRKSLEKRREPMTMEEKLALLQEAEAIVRDHGAEE